MSDTIIAVVYAALGRQLKRDPATIKAQENTSLEQLGLDSHGLMRVLLDIEKELRLSASLELADDALENPATLARGVVQVVAG
jgi:acyl carrier protein